MPLNVALQQPDRDKFIHAMARELEQHTELKLEDYSQVPGAKEYQTYPHGVDPPMQKGSSRRDPEVEGPFARWRPSSGVWGYLLDNICPRGLMDDSLVCFYPGPIIGMAHAVH